MDEKKNPKQESGRMKITDLTAYLQKAKEANQDNESAAMVDAIIAAMKDSGSEELLLLQRKMLEAKFGIGDWQDVLSFQEQTLKEQVEQKDMLGQLGTLINLTGTAINDGDKEKARQYVQAAEKVLAQTSPADIERSLPSPWGISGETLLQLKRAEIERLRNWVT